MTEIAKTVKVNLIVSCLLGQVTLVNSYLTSAK